MVHPQDLSQGRFWVVPTGKLNGESSRSASNRWIEPSGKASPTRSYRPSSRHRSERRGQQGCKPTTAQWQPPQAPPS